MEKVVEKNSSISVTKNTKGYTWDIKIYFEFDNSDSANKVMTEIERIDQELHKKFDSQVTVQ